MIVAIKHRYTNAVLYSVEVDADEPHKVRVADLWGANLSRADLRGADLGGANLIGANLIHADLRSARLSHADLGNANLRSANLSGANLIGADLYGANLLGANLRDANLRDANLSGANLGSANLTGANLCGANLSRADLSRADLRGADLSHADLGSANFHGANLSRAYLTLIQIDLRAVLDAAPAEVAGLLAALDAGRIDGSQYQGACACLVGTVANLRGCDVNKLPSAIAPNASRPAERWFLGISIGDTPDDNPIAAITRDWIAEWQSERGEGELITA